MTVNGASPVTLPSSDMLKLQLYRVIVTLVASVLHVVASMPSVCCLATAAPCGQCVRPADVVVVPVPQLSRFDVCSLRTLDAVGAYARAYGGPQLGCWWLEPLLVMEFWRAASSTS